MSSKTLRMIAVSQQNYLTLKRLGNAGDSFNDVITAVLNKVKILQTGLSFEGPDRYPRSIPEELRRIQRKIDKR
jgi:hypothetical protein